eukprot:scaffold22839_cov171-Amphora_coffeaeformis.AAC.9
MRGFSYIQPIMVLNFVKTTGSYMNWKFSQEHGRIYWLKNCWNGNDSRCKQEFAPLLVVSVHDSVVFRISSGLRRTKAGFANGPLVCASAISSETRSSAKR